MKKKLLVLAALTSAICSTASAEESGVANLPFLGSKGTYLKLEAGYSFPSSFKILDTLGKIDIKKNKGHFGVGIGYNLHENVRLELAYNYNTKWQSRGGVTQPGLTDQITGINLEEAALKYRFKSQYAMPKIYVDLYEAKLPNGATISPYVGGGLGVSWISAKGTTMLNGSDVPVVFAFKTKTRVKAAWEAIGGFTYKHNNTAVDLQYSYNDLGKTRVGVYNSAELDFVGIKAPFRAHNVSLGFRFYI